MGLILDTNVLIDIENGRLDADVLTAFEHHGEAFIAAVTVAELLAGVHLARSVDRSIRRASYVEGIIAELAVLDFTEVIARAYAEIYAYFLKSRRRTEGNVHDLQIAATAITHGYPVLTSNLAEFKRIPGLQVETPLA